MAIGTPIERKFLEDSGVLGTRNLAIASTFNAGTKAILMVTSNANKTVTGVTDTKGNTWAVDATASDGTRAISFASAEVATALVSGTDTLTVTFSNSTSGQVNFWLHEVSGLATSSPFDKTASGTGSGTSFATSATATLSQADEYVQAGFRTTGTGFAWTKGASYSDPTSPKTLTGGIGSACEYKIVSATTAVTADGTWGASGSWVALVATYKGAAVSNVTDSGTCTLALAASGADAPADAASITLTIAPTGGEALGAAAKHSLVRVAITRPSPRVIIPGYVYPGSVPRTTWDAWIAAADPVSHIIANPGSPGGPGTSTDTNYTAVIAQAQAAGITILGYVDTSYARPDVSVPTLDDFNTGANTLLTARTGWHATAIAVTGDTSLKVSTPTASVAQKSTAAAGSNFWATSFLNGEARAKFGGQTGTANLTFLSVFTRFDPATKSGYYLEWYLDGTYSAGRLEVAGGSTAYKSNVASGLGAPGLDEIALRSIGTVHQIWYKLAAGTWTMIDSFDDSASGTRISGPGLIGCRSSATGTVTIDSFGGGEAGTTPLAQIDAWKTLYGINDIFLDQTPSGSADIPYIKLLTDYVRATSTVAGAVVVINPGTTCDEGYAALANILCVFEGTETTYASYTPSSWNANYPANRFLHLVYNAATRASLTADIAQAVTQGAGYVDVVDTAVWFALSGLWNDQTTYLRSSPAAALADAGTCAVGVAASGVEKLTDSGSITIVVTASSAEDIGSVTVALTPSGAESISDVGSISLAIAASGSESQSDAGTCTLVILPAEIEAETDAGTMTIALTASGVGTPADAGTVTLGVAQTGTEALSDGTTVSVTLQAAGSELIPDAGVATLSVVPSTIYLGGYPDPDRYPGSDVYPAGVSSAGEALLDIGTGIATIAPSGASSVTAGNPSDTGQGVLTILATTSDALADAASVSLAIASTSVETLIDAGVVTLSIATSEADTESDAGAITVTLAASGADAKADAGTATVSIVASGAEQPSDATTATITLAASGADTLADAGSITAVVAATGAEVQSDSVAAAIAIVASSTEAIAATITDVLVISQVGTGGVLGADPSDLGTATIAIIASSFNAMDQGLTFSTIQPAGAEVVADAGSVTVSLAASGADIRLEVASVAVVITSGSFESQSDAGQVTITTASTGAETVTDQASVATTITPSGVDSPADAATATITLLATGQIQTADQATSSLTVSPSATAQISDQATVALTIVALSGDQQADAGSVSLTIDPTGAFSLTAGNPSDTGQAVVSLVQTKTESVADEGTASVAVLGAIISEQITDAATQTVVILPASVDQQIDIGRALVVLDLSGTFAVTGVTPTGPPLGNMVHASHARGGITIRRQPSGVRSRRVSR